MIQSVVKNLFTNKSQKAKTFLLENFVNNSSHIQTDLETREVFASLYKAWIILMSKLEEGT